MPTDEELIAQMAADEGATSGGEGIIDSVKNDTIKSLKAAGMMVGLYKPLDRTERLDLRRRFTADAALIAASTLTGGIAGGALKGVAPVARAILGGALSGAAGNAAFAKVEGQPVMQSTGVGALMGMAFGGVAHGLTSITTAAEKGAASVELEKLLARRKEFIAKTSAELRGPGSVMRASFGQLHDIYEGPESPVMVTNPETGRKVPAVTPEVRAAQVRRLGGIPQIDQVSGLPAAIEEKAVSPFEMPTRGVFAQRVMDPFSVSAEPAEQLLDLRSNAVAPGEGTLGRLARGTETLPTGQGLTIEAGQTITPRRDTAGRFIRQFRTTGLSATSPHGEIDKEAQAAARKAFLEFVGGEETGRVPPEGQVLGRTPKGRSYLVPRGRGLGTTEDSIREFLDMGAPEGPTNIAIANSAIRRTLMKLPFGAEIDKVYADATQVMRRVFVPVEVALKQMGTAGSELGARMSKVLDSASALAASDVETIRGLRKLSVIERHNVSHVLNGSDVPMNSRVAEVTKIIRDRLDNVGHNARYVKLAVYSPRSGSTKPFELRNNYFPLEYSQKTINKYMQPGPDREEALKIIMHSEQAISRREAEAVLSRYLKPHMSEFRYGHLQIAREFSLPGFEEDPLKVLPQYFLRAWKRIETAREFGPADESAIKLAQTLQTQGFDSKFALQAYRAFADKEPVPLRDLAGATRTLNMYSLLSTTGLVQFSQHSNTIALTGWKNYLSGLSEFFSRNPISREWAARTGSYMQEQMQDLVPFGEQGLGAWWANAIGLTPLDKANRIVAALAGRYHADDIAAKYAAATAPKLVAQFERELLRMRLVPNEVKAAGGVLTAAQRSTAAQQISLLTQFRGSVLDMPLAKHSAAGQFMYLFKNFAVQQTRFVSQLMSEARKGNTAPLIRYMAATGTLTYATGKALTAAKFGGDIGDLHIPGILPADRKPTTEGIYNYLELTAIAGSLGIAYDGLRGMMNGPDIFRGFLLGPTVNDVVALVSKDIPEVARGNPKQILHDAVKHTPLFGRRIADYFVPLGE